MTLSSRNFFVPLFLIALAVAFAVIGLCVVASPAVADSESASAGQTIADLPYKTASAAEETSIRLLSSSDEDVQCEQMEVTEDLFDQVIKGEITNDQCYSNQVLLTLDGTTAVQDLLTQLDHQGVDTCGLYLVANDITPGQTLILVEYCSDQNPESLSSQLMDQGVATGAEPNYVVELCDAEDNPNSQDSSLLATINDPYASQAWYLGGVNAYSAWDKAKTSGSVTVAVVDSGVDTDHPDLAGNLLLNYGKDVQTGKTGADAVEGTITHGTHVAGIIAACANNSIGIAGVSYNAKILPVKVTDRQTFSSAYLVQAVNYLVELKQSSTDQDIKNLRVVNMSLGSNSASNVSTYQQVVNKASNAGILVVAAVGNSASSTVNYPAACDGALAVSGLKLPVGATASPSSLVFDSSYSNYGSAVDISAPGTSIYSTVIGGSYSTMTGTSMATPMVSGAAALLFALHPDFSPAQVTNVLQQSAYDLGASGKDNYYGYGALDLAAAVKWGEPEPKPDPEPEPAPDPTPSGHTHTFAATVTQPTCTAQGYTTYTCTSCGYSYTGNTVNALGHVKTQASSTPATCTSAGVTTYVCSRCGAFLSEEDTPALGHEWGEWTVITPATYSHEGERTRVCNRDSSHVETQVIDMLRPSDDIEAFAVCLYMKVLDRDPDEQGLAAQVNALRAGTPPAELACGFFTSAEYVAKGESNSQVVERVYQVMFDRASDASGKALWVSYLDNAMSVRAVIAGFSQSQEYKNCFAAMGVNNQSIEVIEPRDVNYGVTSFCSCLYAECLGRPCDIQGLNDQAKAILDGMSASQIAMNFFTGAEFSGLSLPNDQIIERCYKTMMGRASDPEGKAFWLAMMNAGMSVEDLVRGFAQSQEWADICAKYGVAK